MTKKIYKFGRVTLELDPEHVFPNDPGMGTPALVVIKDNTATYNCALGEGEVDGIALTDQEIKWLMSYEDEIDAMWKKQTEILVAQGLVLTKQ